jgi:hypothetical protein
MPTPLPYPYLQPVTVPATSPIGTSINTTIGMNGTSSSPYVIGTAIGVNTVYATDNTSNLSDLQFHQPKHGSITASDVILDGVSLSYTLRAIQERLAILVPDLEKLQKFAAIKAAYDHYKLLEKLCGDETNA